ncbi:uncharacterized protein SPSC_06104 [Sporisorium scitamineum]|uniref:Uncharacterized protein n=1 Tax=Sporisorium scitamineum TaxID=49012 RepID=A0A0F7RWR0_9BASI|nr:hypothetical protein [Sporisorium scitamineum]CDU25933.1 uncharacterized protein SPSC_06104 [Sporisorium scitamineum]
MVNFCFTPFIPSYVRLAIAFWHTLVGNNPVSSNGASSPQQTVSARPSSTLGAPSIASSGSTLVERTQPLVDSNMASSGSTSVKRTQPLIEDSRVSPASASVTRGQSFFDACAAPKDNSRIITIKVDRDQQPSELATAQCESFDAATSASQETSNAAAIVRKRRRKVQGQPLKLIWSRFDLPDAYMFNRKPFSTREMTHVIKLSTDLGDNIFAQRLDLDSKAQMVKALANLPSLSDKPIAIFTAPELLVRCTNQSDLVVLFNRIEDTRLLGPYRAQIKSKGLPFVPAFWIIKGLPIDLGKNKLRADIQSYIVRNEATIGKWRVVYASWQTKPPVHVAIFTGELVIVTDAEILGGADSQTAPAFHGSVPRRINSIQGLSGFSPIN